MGGRGGAVHTAPSMAPPSPPPLSLSPRGGGWVDRRGVRAPVPQRGGHPARRRPPPRLTPLRPLPHPLCLHALLGYLWCRGVACIYIITGQPSHPPLAPTPWLSVVLYIDSLRSNRPSPFKSASMRPGRLAPLSVPTRLLPLPPLHAPPPKYGSLARRTELFWVFFCFGCHVPRIHDPRLSGGGISGVGIRGPKVGKSEQYLGGGSPLTSRKRPA